MVEAAGFEPRSLRERGVLRNYHVSMEASERLELSSAAYETAALPLSYEAVVLALGIEPSPAG